MASQAAALALGSLFVQGAAFLSVIVLARLLSKAELGGYQQLLLIYAIFTPLLIGGIPSALLFFMPRTTDLRERLLHQHVLAGRERLHREPVVERHR